MKNIPNKKQPQVNSVTVSLNSGDGRNCTAVQRTRYSHIYKLSRPYNFATGSPGDMVHL